MCFWNVKVIVHYKYPRKWQNLILTESAAKKKKRKKVMDEAELI